MSYQNKRLFFSLIFLSLILIVRPYNFFILFFSYFIYIFIKSKKNIFTYLSISVLLLFSLYIMHYYRIPLRIPFDVFSLESILEFIYSRQSQVFEGGTLNYSMRESNFIYLLFSYLFRPSIFEVNNLFFMIIALDNLMLLLFVIYRLVICIKFKFQISSEIVFISLFFYFKFNF